MFDQYYVRLPVERLIEESPAFLELGINPEISISHAFLKTGSSETITQGKAMLTAFSSHTLHAPFIDVFPGILNADIRAISFQQMQRVMTIARTWGTFVVVMHYNYDPIYYRFQLDDWLDRAADFFRRLLEPDASIMIALENVADPTPYILLQLLDRIGSERVIPCLDFGHQHVFGRLDLREWIFYLRNRPHIHFHFHDNDGGEDDHLPLGRGTIDWRLVKSSLRSLPGSFSVTLEPHTNQDMLDSLSFYRTHFL